MFVQSDIQWPSTFGWAEHLCLFLADTMLFMVQMALCLHLHFESDRHALTQELKPVQPCSSMLVHDSWQVMK